jgi:hypothetical protein
VTILIYLNENYLKMFIEVCRLFLLQVILQYTKLKLLFFIHLIDISGIFRGMKYILETIQIHTHEYTNMNYI